MNRLLGRIIGAAALLLFAACGGGSDAGGGIGGTGGSLGTLRVSLTDAPSCGYDAVNVTVERVRVHQSDSAADADGGWYDIVLSPARRIDLLSLSNGVLLELGQVALPAGRYPQLRLVLVANDAGRPLANSVVPSGGSEIALSTPSAQQSGLKLKTAIDIAANQVADFVIDFDACRSVVKRGNSGQYNLKPVLSVLPLLSDAGLRVVGYVEPAIALPSTVVSVQFNGVPVKSTVPEPSGRFVLYPVPTGSYDLVVSAAGRVTAIVSGVPVVQTGHTLLNDATLPIAPPASAQRTVAGTVTPADASVRALQALSGGSTVEVGWAPVDGLTGGFAIALPIDAPVRTTFAAIGPASFSFAADAVAAALYSIEAAHEGAVKTQPIDAAFVVPPLVFTLP
jgi:hypothetical protein